MQNNKPVREKHLIETGCVLELSVPGFEPANLGSKSRCSTDWAKQTQSDASSQAGNSLISFGDT